MLCMREKMPSLKMHVLHQDIHNSFHEQYHSILLELSTLEQVWHSQNQSTQPHGTGETQHFQISKLPEIKLPMFNGTCAEWPAYKELLIGLILKRARLQDYAKLHYLRSSLTGVPFTLIEGFTLCDESLMPAWKTLVRRYVYKRVFLNDQLGHLADRAAAQTRNPASLNTLISEMSKIRKSLHILIPKEDLGDCILAHGMSRLLDKLTREAWETSRVNITELPVFEEFETFLISRVRVLETAADTPAGS